MAVRFLFIQRFFSEWCVLERHIAWLRPFAPLLSCGLILLFAVALSISLVLSNLHDRAIADAERQLQTTASVVAEDTARTLQAIELVQGAVIERIQSLGVASAEDYERVLSGPDMTLNLTDKIASLPYVDAISLFDSDGQLINSSRSQPISERNYADREYFLALKSNPALVSYISEPVRSRRTGNWLIVVARKVVSPNGEFLGAVLGLVRLQYLEQFYQKLVTDADESIAFFRNDALLLARHPHVDPAIGRSFVDGKFFAKIMSRADRGVVHQVSRIDNRERMIAGAAVPHFPLMITVSTTPDAALADWRVQARYLLCLAAALVLVIGGVGLVVIRRFRDQKVQLETALDNMRQALLMFDRHGRLVVVNRRYREMYQLSAAQAKPGRSLRELLQARAVAGTFAGDIDDYIKERQARPEHVRSRAFTLPDGRTIAVTDRLMETGGWVSTHDDITEQREAENKLTAARAEAERAEAEARAAHARLRDAFEVVPEALALFDSEDRYILWNDRYAQLYADHEVTLRPGLSFEEMLHAGLARGQYPEALGREEEWLKQRLAMHAKPQCTHEQPLPNNRWVRVEERRTQDGGSIGIRVDITELKRREASFRLLFDSNPVPMYLAEQGTLRIVAVNDAAIALYGYSYEEFLKLTVFDLRSPEDWDEMREAARSGAGYTQTGQMWRHRKANGVFMDVAIYTRPLTFEGRPAALAAVIDLTDRKRAEDELRRTREFLDTVIEHVPVTIFVKEPRELRYILINRAGEQHYGMSRREIIGKSSAELFPKEAADWIAASDRRLLETLTEQFVPEMEIESPRNGKRVVTATRLPILDGDGKLRFLLGVVEDVTERTQAQARIAYMAQHDALTELPNRVAFKEGLIEAIETSIQDNRKFAVLSMGFDRFTEINDIFGHAVGDALLRGFAQRLEKVAAGAFAARLGGDEFGLILTEVAQPAAAEALAARLQEALHEEFEINGHQHRLALSIGVAIFPADGADAASILRSADTALHRAKASSRGSIRFFEPDMDRQLRERRALQEELKFAVSRGELILYYQPQARIDGEIFGFEALIRWNHPTRGMVSPGTFIPIAEETGLIVEIGEWVVREACREAASWTRPLQIALNLSPVQFRHGDLVGLIHSALLESGLSPRRLELEVTEGVLIDDFDGAVAILRRLKAMGVRTAMDDFGTGYSSLSYLQSFPFDKIKIDRAFISNLDRNPQSAAIVRATIGLGRGLGLPVLAEGVESDSQLAFLAIEMCDEFQGYLLGRPSPIAGYVAVIESPTASVQDAASAAKRFGRTQRRAQ
jgi:diguanylate cyclase (GGDEF)-like protein/PAS domain S-box-containing protein